jgi:hypothetical protein
VIVRFRLVLATVVLAACVLAATPVAGARDRALHCSTHGLAVSGSHGAGYRVVALSTSGFTCAKARGLARQLAKSLLTTGTIDVSNASVAMSTELCTGCVPRTTISLTLSNGRLTVSLTGSASAGATTPEVPAVPATPSGGGSGSVIA